MAGTLNVFRKYQKAILAVLCILLVFSWLVGGFISQSMRSHTEAQNKVLATWKFGEITEQDMQRLVMGQNRVAAFTAEAHQRAYGYNFARRTFNEAFIFRTLLMSKKAEQLGIVVSDEMIKNFIKDNSGGFYLANWFGPNLPSNLPTEAIRQTLSEMRMSEQELFASVRMIMQANLLQILFENGIRAEPPAERYSQFLRLDQKLSAEALPVRVADFLEQVKDPSEETLKKYFEDHKEAIASGIEPGFRQPYKAALQYAKADFAALVKEIEPTISEEKVKQFYEEHKDTKYISSEWKLEQEKKAKQSDLFPLDSKSSTTPAPSFNLPGSFTPTQPSPALPEGQSVPDSKSGPTPEKPAAPDEKSAAPKSEPKSDAKQPADPKAPGKQSSRERATPMTLVAFNQADPKAPPTKNAAPATKAADPKTAPAAPKIDPAKSPAKSDVPAKSDPPAKRDDPAKPADAKSDPKGETKAPLEKYTPFEEVKEKIRHELAQAEAQKKISAAFKELRGVVRDYSQKLGAWKFRTANKEKVEEPLAPSYGDLAKKLGLTMQTTELLSQDQLALQTDLGRAQLGEGGESSNVSVKDRIYARQTLTDYVPEEAVDDDMNQYLYWKIKDKAQHTPTFEEVRPDVLLAWKMQEARKLAEKEANRLLEIAKKDPYTKLAESESLTKASGKRVWDIKNFAWKRKVLTSGDILTNTIEHIEDAGDTFLSAVYQLGLKEPGLAWNNPHSVLYLVRVYDIDPNANVLFARFIAQAPTGSFYDNTSLGPIFVKWQSALEEEMGVKWNRKLGQAGGPDSEE